MEHGGSGAFPFDSLSLFLLHGLYFLQLIIFYLPLGLLLVLVCLLTFSFLLSINPPLRLLLFPLFFISSQASSIFFLILIFPSSFGSFPSISSSSLSLSCPPISHSLLPFDFSASFHILFLVFLYTLFSCVYSSSIFVLCFCFSFLSCSPFSFSVPSLFYCNYPCSTAFSSTL